MNQERKMFKQSIPAIVLFVLTIGIAIRGLFPGEGGYVTVLGVAGYMLASLLHAKRTLDDSSRAWIKKIYLGVSVLAGMMSLLGALFTKSFSIWVLLDVIGGIGSLIMLVLLVDKLCGFIETCSNTAFYIVMAVSILVAPSIFFMLANLLSGILALIIFGVLIMMVSKGGLSMVSDQMASGSGAQKLFFDKEGNVFADENRKNHSNDEIDRKNRAE